MMQVPGYALPDRDAVARDVDLGQPDAMLLIGV